jgi:ABC-2 type transport system permease protein
MRAVGHLLPPSYVFENMRSVVGGHGYSGGGLLTGTALALLDILLAAWLFTHIYRYAVRSGLLARYSAESAS